MQKLLEPFLQYREMSNADLMRELTKLREELNEEPDPTDGFIYSIVSHMEEIKRILRSRDVNLNFE